VIEIETENNSDSLKDEESGLKINVNEVIEFEVVNELVFSSVQFSFSMFYFSYLPNVYINL